MIDITLDRKIGRKNSCQGINCAARCSAQLSAFSFPDLHTQQEGEENLSSSRTREPQSMQAQVTYKEVNGVGLRNVIENLTRIDPNTNEVLPMLATSWEQVEPTRWHFKLREGVMFHDGSPMDGEAVARQHQLALER